MRWFINTKSRAVAYLYYIAYLSITCESSDWGFIACLPGTIFYFRWFFLSQKQKNLQQESGSLMSVADQDSWRVSQGGVIYNNWFLANGFRDSYV